MEKSRDAYRTIREVAEELDLPQHVLRFWETRFAQIKPMKRGGGRRYYRPEDVDLLRAIRHLLYGEGYTIKGVQRILKDNGTRAVAQMAIGMSPALEAAHAVPQTSAAHDGFERSLSRSPAAATAAPEATPLNLGICLERLDVAHDQVALSKSASELGWAPPFTRSAQANSPAAPPFSLPELTASSTRPPTRRARELFEPMLPLAVEPRTASPPPVVTSIAPTAMTPALGRDRVGLPLEGLETQGLSSLAPETPAPSERSALRRVMLSMQDIERLKAVLFELGECERTLEAVGSP